MDERDNTELAIMSLEKPVMMPDGVAYFFIAGLWKVLQDEEQLHYSNKIYIKGMNKKQETICNILSSDIYAEVPLSYRQYKKLEVETCYKMF